MNSVSNLPVSPEASQQNRAYFIDRMRWFRFNSASCESPETNLKTPDITETELVTDGCTNGCNDTDNMSDAEAIEPLLPVAHRAVAYGDGFFSTMKVQSGEVYWLDYHQRRIHTHATALQLYLPKSQQHLLWQQVNHYAGIIDTGMIKVIVTRQAQNIRGYGFSINDTDNGCDIFIGVLATDFSSPSAYLSTQHPLQPSVQSSQLTNVNQARYFALRQALSKHELTQIPIQPAITAITLQSRISCLPPPLVGLKTLNRLDNVLASAELKQQQARIPAHLSNPLTEGLVQDMLGYWVEGTMSNVFYQLDTEAQWFTPPIDRSGVNGVMRQVLMDSFDKTAYPIIERHLEDTDIAKLTGLFFCNAVRGIMPVAELIVDDNKIIFPYPSILYN